MSLFAKEVMPHFAPANKASATATAGAPAAQEDR
jgi:hypothetical protein